MNIFDENWLDVSMPIHSGMKVYKDKSEKKPKFIVRATHKENGHYEGSIEIDLHTGTHIDMPLHMMEGGENSTGFDVQYVNGESVVIDLSTIDHPDITKEDLEKYSIKANTIVILKTHNSFEKAFNYEFDYLAQSGAEFLFEKGVKCVGIDAVGIERSQPTHPTHQVLLGNGIYIIEGLELKDIKTGRYELLCLPLKIEGVEGLPARAMLKYLGELL